MTEYGDPYRILEGDCRSLLKGLPDESVDCCVTSPPYWKTRDYEIEAQTGFERTPKDFTSELVKIFSEVKRILKPAGTLWLNLGDSYNNRTKIRTTSHEPDLNGFTDAVWADRSAGNVRMTLLEDGLKEKDLIGIPWMVAVALRSDGWYLRQDIIWSKTFGKPESVKDRVTKSHEYLFILSKSKHYYFDRAALGPDAQRSVWTIAPGGYKGAHFAVMPLEMALRCVKGGCPAGGTVLDPFGGSGTTAIAAMMSNRDAILIELKPDYVAFAMERITNSQNGKN